MSSRMKAPLQTSKVCNGCAVEKPASEFYKYSTGRLRHSCRTCYATHNKEQRAKHSEKRNAYEAARGPGWVRSGRAQYEQPEPLKWAAYIKRVYGLTAERFSEILEHQGGVCAICRQECNRSNTTRMCVDHDHVTGHVRGLLCFQCNVGLGKFSDSPALLRDAATYLEERAA